MANLKLPRQQICLGRAKLATRLTVPVFANNTPPASLLLLMMLGGRLWVFKGGALEKGLLSMNSIERQQD
jgi:hypothetical protein